MSVSELFFALLRFTICEKPLPEKVKTVLSEHSDAYVSLFELSKKHDLTHLVCEALDQNHLLPEDEIGEKFRHQRMSAAFRYEQLHYEYERLCQALENAGIHYMPLKGSVIRDLYPEPWYRTSCDIDVLVHKSDLERTCDLLRTELNYQDHMEDTHDVEFWASENIHVEIHFDLIDKFPKFNPVLSRAWETATLQENTKYHHLMTDEMFYFYHIGHMAKHVINGGCGIRTFLDLWILDHKLNHDQEKRDTLLKEGGLFKFAQKTRKLSEVWFSESEKDEISEAFERFLLQGGSYGTLENRVKVGHVKKGGKIRYFFSLVWLPYTHLKQVYPSLAKHKWAFPFYQVRRWFKVLFKGMNPGAKKHIQTSKNVTAEQREEVANLLKQLDL